MNIKCCDCKYYKDCWEESIKNNIKLEICTAYVKGETI